MNHKLTIRAKCPAGIEQENRYDEEDLLLVTDEHPVYGDCEPPRVRTDAVTLSDIFDNKESWGEAVEMYYEYNHEMGEENWSHQISFLGRADPNLWKNVELLGKAPVVCVSGEVGEKEKQKLVETEAVSLDVTDMFLRVLHARRIAVVPLAGKS